MGLAFCGAVAARVLGGGYAIDWIAHEREATAAATSARA
jgi:hypothetical protein